jgi:hypothetical protein
MKTKRLSLQQLLDSEVTVDYDGNKIIFKVGNVQGDKEVVTLANDDRTISVRFYYLDLDRLIKGEETLAPVTLSCKTTNTKIKTYEDKVRGKQDKQKQD